MTSDHIFEQTGDEMTSDHIEAATRITEALIAKMSPAMLVGSSSNDPKTPEQWGEALGKLYAAAFKQVFLIHGKNKAQLEAE